VPESRFAELKAARQLSIALWALPELRLTGEVRELSPAADPVTRTYAARIRIANPPPEVRLGMTARVALAASGESTVVVPLGAVVDQGKGPLVWVVEAGKATPRPVRPLSFREDGVAIAEGLRAGERVVVAGTQRLIAGQDVEIREAPQPAQQR
jgi:RND family efflux transporter MFP subunit